MRAIHCECVDMMHAAVSAEKPWNSGSRRPRCYWDPVNGVRVLHILIILMFLLEEKKHITAPTLMKIYSNNYQENTVKSCCLIYYVGLRSCPWSWTRWQAPGVHSSSDRWVQHKQVNRSTGVSVVNEKLFFPTVSVDFERSKQTIHIHKVLSVRQF